MNKREFLGRVSGKTGLTKRDTERTMDAVFQTLGEVLAQGGRLVVSGFGTFATVQRTARTARNPRTGAPVALPACRAAVLRPAKVLKIRLNPVQDEKGAKNP